MRGWVFDASPIIALGKAGLLRLPADIGIDALIPEAVAVEVDAGDDADPAKVWLREGASFTVVQATVLPVVAAWGLGEGESAVISYAIGHPGAEAVLDDRAARACAQTLGVRPRGTLGLLVLARREGVIAAVRPAIDALLAAGYHLGPDLIAAVLADVGES